MTLAELMVAMTVSTMVFAALFSSWGFIGRSSVMMGHYAEMNSTGRTGLEVFARDLRRARDLETNYSNTGMTLEMEEEDGTRPHVNYYYDGSTKTLVRQEGSGGATEAVFKDVEWMEFSYFDTHGDTALNALSTRLIQLELVMTRESLGREATKKIVSARYIMRNKRFGQ